MFMFVNKELSNNSATSLYEFKKKTCHDLSKTPLFAYICTCFTKKKNYSVYCIETNCNY